MLQYEQSYLRNLSNSVWKKIEALRDIRQYSPYVRTN